MGKPLPSVELEIRDAEGKPRRRPASAARSTCAASRSRASTSGARSRVGADGWFPTRDGGFLDEDGYLFLEGRIDDVIVRGGENLSPGEIEDVLLEHPAVADVRGGRRAGRGVGRGRRGRGGAQGRRSAPAPRELQDWVKQHLRSSRVPQLVRFEPELPYNETGKLLRRKVRESLAPS